MFSHLKFCNVADNIELITVGSRFKKKQMSLGNMRAKAMSDYTFHSFCFLPRPGSARVTQFCTHARVWQYIT